MSQRTPTIGGALNADSWSSWAAHLDNVPQHHSQGESKNGSRWSRDETQLSSVVRLAQPLEWVEASVGARPVDKQHIAAVQAAV